VALELVAGPPGALRGDRLQLSRLLRNLVDNALRVAAPESKVEVELQEDDGEVRLAVMDRGPGVPIALRGRLFEPFMRLESGRARLHGGTGLGLAIAREIARVHGGDLTYEDRPGGGACFVAVLRALQPTPDRGA
jgi:signal transduction histidine kinase